MGSFIELIHLMTSLFLSMLIPALAGIIVFPNESWLVLLLKYNTLSLTISF